MIIRQCIYNIFPCILYACICALEFSKVLFTQECTVHSDSCQYKPSINMRRPWVSDKQVTDNV